MARLLRRCLHAWNVTRSRHPSSCSDWKASATEAIPDGTDDQDAQGRWLGHKMLFKHRHLGPVPAAWRRLNREHVIPPPRPRRPVRPAGPDVVVRVDVVEHVVQRELADARPRGAELAEETPLAVLPEPLGEGLKALAADRGAY